MNVASIEFEDEYVRNTPPPHDPYNGTLVMLYSEDRKQYYQAGEFDRKNHSDYACLSLDYESYANSEMSVTRARAIHERIPAVIDLLKKEGVTRFDGVVLPYQPFDEFTYRMMCMVVWGKQPEELAREGL
jgi:hypothetical protein